MPRLIAALAALAALVTAVPSAAQVGSGKIAFASTVGIYTINADGRDRALLRAGSPSRLQIPAWSPDGSRLAFMIVETGDQRRLAVIDADGSDERDIAAGRLQVWRHPWSSDGTRIAYVKDSEIYTASASGGDELRLTSDGRAATAPAWSPTGSTLVFPRRVQAFPEIWELFAVEADGSGLRQITSSGTGPVINSLPAWSPNGQSIAFLRGGFTGESAVYVVRPDGTELHRVAEVRGLGTSQPAWSPDGARIAFTSAVNSGYSRYGGQGQEVFSVNADGSGLKRLTELAPKVVLDLHPVWSPDGSRILFTRVGEPATMNPDGTCEEKILLELVNGAPSWQPLPGGPPLGPKQCHAIAVDAEVSETRSSATITATVSNEGTEPLTNVELVVRPHNDLSLRDLPGDGCSIRRPRAVCRIARLDAGREWTFYLRAQARRVGLDRRSRAYALRARLDVTAAGQLLPTGRETDEIRFYPIFCSYHDPGRGTIHGTPYPDRICGRRGADRIHPLDGRDVVVAGSGPDVIFARDRFSDTISCGPGRDVVFVDRKDKISRDCERVRRSR